MNRLSLRGLSLPGVFGVLLALRVVLALTGMLGPVGGLLSLVLWVIGFILAIRLVRHVLRHSIWRLRNRLIVTYVFIAVVPIVLILILAASGAYIVSGQLAMYLVRSELDRRVSALATPARILLHTPASRRPSVMAEIAPFLHDRFPRLEILIRDVQTLHYPPDSTLAGPPAGWSNAEGVVIKDGHFYTWAHVLDGGAEVVMLAPLSGETLSTLVRDLGEVTLLNFEQGDKRVRLVSEADVKGSRHAANRVPPAANQFDVPVQWFNLMNIPHWAEPGSAEPVALHVATRPSAILNTVFGQKLDTAQVALIIFLTVAALFLLVEIISLVIGVSLTRSMTSAVHNLYAGTKRVTAGDFSHRIEVRGHDQLSELGSSFNQMTEQIERLIVVEKEKERLQSEIEIASEVQNQLFPKAVPALKTLELTGVCKPARMVSGDYYDFLCLPEGNVALAIGDVAGKGISAALLMASIQSIMRTQLASENAGLSTCGMVAKLNKQLYANTSPEKYATFYFAIYDEQSKRLTYTNAGHLPPILLRNGASTLLEVTGTVVGAFPVIRYEELSIPLESGDLLVAYTDGITEPENAYGEEFGAERLTDLLLKFQDAEAREIIARVMESVEQWASTPEMPDDMTLLLARAT